MSDVPQGPGWWLASDGKWYPPEQFVPQPEYAAAPGPGGPAAPATGRPEIGETLSYAWKKLQQHPAPLLIVSLIAFLVLGALTALGYIGLLVSFIGTSECVRYSAATGRCIQDGETSINGNAVLWGSALVLGLLVGHLLVDVVMIRMGLLVTAGEPITARRLLSVKGVVSYLVAALLLGVLALVGLAFCIIPGLAVLAFGRFFGLYVLDKGQGPIKAIRSSFTFVRANLGQVLLFLLVTVGIFYAGQAACYVGLIAVLPFNALATTYFYKRYDGQIIAP